MDDHAVVARLLRAAEPLTWWRRRLVARRCRRIFGSYWTDLAIDYPSNGAVDETGSVAAWFAAAMKGQEPQGPLDALMHRAYCELPPHKLLDGLCRELRLLRNAL